MLSATQEVLVFRHGRDEPERHTWASFSAQHSHEGAWINAVEARLAVSGEWDTQAARRPGQVARIRLLRVDT